MPKAGTPSGVSEHEPAGAGHPQFGLKLLLQSLGVVRDAVDAD